MADWSDLIIRKREGEELESEEIASFVQAVQKEGITPEQSSAFLMAAVLNDLSDEETAAFTKSLLNSGQVLRFGDMTYPPIDLGESGGLGSSAVIAALPIAAVYGVKLPVVAERSLRLIGGLLDRFESIPGFRTDVSLAEFQESVRTIGIAVIGQTTDLAPAETKINQLRSTTGTLGGVSLTVASLLARKAAAGARGLAVEIACGDGAVATSLKQAHDFADRLVNVGEMLGLRIGGIITDRNNPIGAALGDSLEMQEAISILKGEGAAEVKDTALTLAASLLIVGQLASDLGQGKELAQNAINDGRAIAKLKEFVANQGGDTRVIDDLEAFPRGQGKREIVSHRGGYVKAIDFKSLAEAWRHLGGSREVRGEATDHRVGLLCHKRVGDRVEANEPLVTIHTSEKSKTEQAIEAVEEAFLLSPAAVDRRRILLETFGVVR